MLGKTKLILFGGNCIEKKKEKFTFSIYHSNHHCWTT